MGLSRFVRPQTCTLKISNGDTLTVKRQLTAGEQRAAYARMYLAGVDGTLKVDPFAAGVGLVTAYLLDWSLAGEDGAIVPIRGVSVDELTAALDTLDMESFTEIKEAIEAHDAAQLEEREEAKKKTANTTGDAPISSLPSAAVGASIGSAS